MDDIRLSEHFWLSELIVSDWAIRNGVDNTPDEAGIENLRRLCRLLLEPVRSACGSHVLYVSSGYRCPRVNTEVGGSQHSEHMDARAADFRVRGYGTPLEVCRRILAAGIQFNQLIWEYDAWTHASVALVGATPKLEVLTIRRGTGYMRGLVVPAPGGIPGTTGGS